MIDFVLDIGLFICLLGLCGLVVMVADTVIGWLIK